MNKINRFSNPVHPVGDTPADCQVAKTLGALLFLADSLALLGATLGAEFGPG